MRSDRSADGEPGEDARTRRLIVRAPVVVAAGGRLADAGPAHRIWPRAPGDRPAPPAHPAPVVAGLYPEPIDMWRGTMQAARSTEFARPGRQQRLRDRVCAGPSRTHGPRLPWEGTEAHEELMGRARRIGPLIAVTRDGGEGRTTLTKAGRVRVDYDLDAAGSPRCGHALDVDGEIAGAAGAEEIVAVGAQPASYGRAGGGGTRRGSLASRRSRSVRLPAEPGQRSSRPTRWARSDGRHGTRPSLDPRAESGEAVGDDAHLVGGLYVGDGSLFPTGIGVNPMITIMALARRVARTILAETRGAPSAAVGTSSGRGPDRLRRRLVVRAVIRLRETMISATPTTITAPATTCSGVTVSFRTIAPRTTATTGFTNA